MIATVLCLVGLLAASWLYHAWQLAQWTQERARLVNAAIAESPADFVVMERQRTAPKPKARDDDDHNLEPIGW